MKIAQSRCKSGQQTFLKKVIALRIVGGMVALLTDCRKAMEKIFSAIQK